MAASKQITLRLPAHMLAQLAVIAKENDVSVNAEIVRRLHLSFRYGKPKNLPDFPVAGQV